MDKKAYYEANKERIKEREKAYREANKERIKERKKAYREANKERMKERKKAYREANKERIKERNKAYKEANKERIKERNKAYYKAYYEANKERNKAYREANKERMKERMKAYLEANPLYKLSSNIRNNIGKSIRKNGYTKRSRTQDILGCDYQTFKAHMERQFKKGMSWENFGQWHLDHIYPVSLAKDEQHLIELNHYTNFQPLWAKENLSKSNKIINPIQIKLTV